MYMLTCVHLPERGRERAVWKLGLERVSVDGVEENEVLMTGLEMRDVVQSVPASTISSLTVTSYCEAHEGAAAGIHNQ